MIPLLFLRLERRRPAFSLCDLFRAHLSRALFDAQLAGSKLRCPSHTPNGRLGPGTGEAITYSKPLAESGLDLLTCRLISDATNILNSIKEGDRHAAEQLLPLVYQELRKLAAQKMTAETPGQTLQPTALVHEAWLRLTGAEPQHWDSRGHFFAAAAEAMRRILIENARRKQRLKHGGGLQRLDLDQIDIAIDCKDEQLLAVDEALAKLEIQDKSLAQLIKLRFFAGLSNVEAAQVLGMAERTAKRQWAYARAWLYEELRRSFRDT